VAASLENADWPGGGEIGNLQKCRHSARGGEAAVLTVNCPNCKRALQAPEESGDHRVRCPACGVSFTVEFASGAVRASMPEGIRKEPPPQPEPSIVADDPPEWPAVGEHDVYFDTDNVRTRRINTTFMVVTTGCLALGLALLVAADAYELTCHSVVALLAVPPACGLIAALVVSYFVTPNDAQLNPTLSEAPEGKRWRKPRRNRRQTDTGQPAPAAPPSPIQPKEPSP
jgi:hypothetical protein